MHALNQLIREHETIRARLSLFEAAIGLETDARFVAGELAVALAGELAAHSRHERRLCGAWRSALRSSVADSVPMDHARACEELAILSAHELASPIRAMLHPSMTTWIAALRSEMHEQERRLFPAIEGTRMLQELGRDKTNDLRLDVRPDLREFSRPSLFRQPGRPS